MPEGNQKEREYGQEILQSHITDQTTAPNGKIKQSLLNEGKQCQQFNLKIFYVLFMKH